MSFQSAIAVLKDKITRYTEALRTLEELDPSSSLMTQPAEEAPAPAAFQPVPAPNNGKRPHVKNGSSRSEGAAKKRRSILEYISEHPACSAKDIAKHTGLPITSVSLHLGLAKKEKRVEMLGTAHYARYRMAVKAGAIARTEPPALSPEKYDDEDDPKDREPSDPAIESQKPFGCTLCSRRFHVKGSLLSHMRINHHATEI